MYIGVFCAHLPSSKADYSRDSYPGSVMVKLLCGISSGCLVLENKYVDSLKKVVGNVSRWPQCWEGWTGWRHRNVMSVGRNLCVCSVFPSEMLRAAPHSVVRSPGFLL